MTTPQVKSERRVAVCRALAGRQLTWNELRAATDIPAKGLRPLLAEMENEKVITSGFPEDCSVARRWWLMSEPLGYPEWLERPEEDDDGDWDDGDEVPPKTARSKPRRSANQTI